MNIEHNMHNVKAQSLEFDRGSAHLIETRSEKNKLDWTTLRRKLVYLNSKPHKNSKKGKKVQNSITLGINQAYTDST